MGLDPDLYARIAKMRREPGKKISDPLFMRAVETLTPQETYQATDDGRLLTLFLPLENRQECHDCHGDEHKVRGIVRVSLGLEKLDAGLRAARNRQIVIVILTIIGVTATLLVFMGRVVLRPIAHVVGAARQIGSGNFAARVAVRNQDEIGELGRAINDMAGRLSSAHENLEARNTELATTLQELQESMRKVELLEQVKGELVKFVPEAVTKLLEQNPNARELEKREADVSVLFLDVEGYTRLSEQLPPQRLNRMIQDYFSSFLEIIRAHHGDVNETAGDGLMVIFQSEGAQRATRSMPPARLSSCSRKWRALISSLLGSIRRWRSTWGSTAVPRWWERPSSTQRVAGAGPSPPRDRRPTWRPASRASQREARLWWDRKPRSGSRNTMCYRKRENTS